MTSLQRLRRACSQRQQLTNIENDMTQFLGHYDGDGDGDDDDDDDIIIIITTTIVLVLITGYDPLVTHSMQRSAVAPPRNWRRFYLDRRDGWNKSPKR